MTRIGEFNVERMEGPRPGNQDYLPLGIGVSLVIGHTTEGSTVNGAVGTLRSNFSAPHFVIGERRIVQMRPGWAQAATVRGDNSRAWQVEKVGFASQKVHRLTPATWDPDVALTRWFHEEQGVPLATVPGWRDDLSDITTILAIEGNTRRLTGKALQHRGFVMHLDVPKNSHWDEGAYDWSALFAEVRGGDDEMGYAEFEKGLRARRQGKPVPKDATGDFKLGYDVARDIEEARKTPVPGTPPPDDALRSGDTVVVVKEP